MTVMRARWDEFSEATLDWARTGRRPGPHALTRSHTVSSPRFSTHPLLAGAACGYPRNGVFSGSSKSLVNGHLL